MRRSDLVDNVLGWTSAPAAIRPQLLNGHYKSVVVTAFWSNVVATCAIGALIWHDVEPHILLGWIAAVAAAGFLMRAFVARELARSPAGLDATAGALKMMAVEFLYGTLLASGAFALYMDATPLARGVLLVYLWAASIVRIYTYIPGLHYARTLPAAIAALTATSLYDDRTMVGVTVVFSLFVLLRGDLTQRVHRGIRDQLRLQNELRDQGAALSEANEAKSRILATMSHELRPPLLGVIGMARLLQRDETGETHHRARVIERSGTALLNLLNDILEFVRAPSRDASRVRAAFDLHLLLNEIAALMQTEVGGGGIELSIAADVPRYVLGDEGALRRVLFNLTSNAVKYGGGAPIVVSAETAAGDARDSAMRLRFAVRDHGPGILPKDRERIFEEFVRLDDTAPHQPGTGLGLAICRQLVTGMGGKIELDSAPGTGSRFHFTLPFDVADAPAATARRAHPRTKTRALDVLLVEDLAINREVITTCLTNFGHRVSIAVTGEEAVQRAATQNFDVILMDVKLPGIDGMTATKRIRGFADPKRAQVPIVALTASVFPEDKAHYMACGTTAVLAKSSDFNRLAEMVAALADRGEDAVPAH